MQISGSIFPMQSSMCVQTPYVWIWNTHPPAALIRNWLIIPTGESCLFGTDVLDLCWSLCTGVLDVLIISTSDHPANVLSEPLHIR